MSIKTKPRRAALVVLGAGAVIVGGAYGGVALAEGTVASDTVEDNIAADQYPKPANPDYAINAKGLTYGTAAQANVPDEEPDLILVVSDAGAEGYVYTDELNPPDFKSPQEALAWQEERYASDFVLGVYESDGATKIGTFTIPKSEN
ncbi:hypothetical protein [Ornithinimicrobium avium]|uniref:Uncharacterized protein n=1 Tax=Ornithinimicrobium avium TaxID=2283195 RepID=A0A345NPV1_9MICO|nr:hypothetical protein [Ornithinimicrobium avium]AXH97059.1 hypothetical protein DV701_13845 [Ornithinimicrobium avium]